MFKEKRTHSLEDIEFDVIYSRRRTLGISVLPDSSVVVRVPYLTSYKTIVRIVQEKASWIKKHRDSYRKNGPDKPCKFYIDGETHLFRGNESVLKVRKSTRAFVRFYDSSIEIGLSETSDPLAIKKLLYKGYKNEALVLFPELLKKTIEKHGNQMFRPASLVVRTMKRRWGQLFK